MVQAAGGVEGKEEGGLTEEIVSKIHDLLPHEREALDRIGCGLEPLCGLDTMMILINQGLIDRDSKEYRMPMAVYSAWFHLRDK